MSAEQSSINKCEDGDRPGKIVTDLERPPEGK